MMTKPVTYFTSSNQIDKLVERFGSQLDLLDREQKLELRIVLTYFVFGQEQMGESYSLNDAWFDSLQTLMIEDAELMECLSILQGITISDAESLQEALLAQCKHGNARLKNAVETTTEALVGRGIPHDLAREVAIITHKVDPMRDRTSEEQATVTKVHKMLTVN
ncbi:MAG: hypothetical protein KME22_07950 [Hassallia sp. WJT32-NPBG1]|jgi:hypothetical protein|nr:hypothetical protein [Hassallia sp. WJT32-NPBG1]